MAYFPRYGRLLTKIFGTKGPEDLSQISPELMPSFIVANDRIEHGFPADEYYASSDVLTATAAAATNEMICLTAGKGVLVTVLEAILLSAVATHNYNLLVSRSGALSVTPLVCTPLDGRCKGTGTTAGVSNTQGALVGTTVELVTPVAGTMSVVAYRFRAAPYIVLKAGDQLIIGDQTQNENVEGLFIFRERPVETSEL